MTTVIERLKESCTRCDGSGEVLWEGGFLITCPDCGGSGYKKPTRQGGAGMNFSSEPRYPIAHKRHICDWCGEGIKIGEKYLYQFQAHDVVSLRLHTECEQAMLRESPEEGDPLIRNCCRGLTEYECDELDKEVSE